ncbi:MAG TPA: alpha-glucan family phosphorylase [Dehalococcoidia bacterium]|nr:alpha-glucan family phosphorylase [Dehalococcoidia bacterium]
MTSDARIAYFSMEIGLRTEMPTYSGGLGVLSGDTLRAAADLGTPMVAITLLYRQGFFRQHLASDGSQTETTPAWEPERFLEPVAGRVKLRLEGHDVSLRAWLLRLRGVNGAEVPIYMLDADLPENTPEDCALTGQLYGGDERYRLRQEALLGIGGVAMLRALGYNSIETYHMNEGHSALLTIELLRDESPREAGLPTHAAIAKVRDQCVFTTHTPVPAGHDRFPISLVAEVLGDELAEAIHQLPCCEGHVLNMTYLGLFFSRYVNGVSQRHGEVAQSLYPDYHIRSITNGVHAVTWVSEPFADLFDRRIPGWRLGSQLLRRTLNIPVEDVMTAHTQAKRQLLSAIRQRTGALLDPSVMTIGFARRAATYKRADLVFGSTADLRHMVHQAGRLQFVYAGKAHPHDEPAKDIIRRVFAAKDELQDEIPVVYLEEHDMDLAKLLCSGVDVWLNNPEKPLEASGTSGMKAALNGVPSLSVLDGWWPEGWIEGVTGWSIGDGPEYQETSDTDRASLYNKLNYVVVPLYYGAPTNYGRVMRSTIALNGAYFTSQRMLEQYTVEAYTTNPVVP